MKMKFVSQWVKKLPVVWGSLFLITYPATAQTTASPPASNVSQPALQTRNYQIIEAGADHRVWQRIDYETQPSGKAIPHIHKYTELATGLNHLVNAQWVASKEEIDILPDGNSAAATNGQHQAFFPGDIAEGVIELDTPDGLKLQSRPIALSYDDGSNTVLIAILTNSPGYLFSANQVIYPEAFTGIKADLLYTYTKAGFSQDIILREQPPDPVSLGLNLQTTRLQVLTEFFNPPQPTITPMTLPEQAGISLTDKNLNFGVMEMTRGRAFLLGSDAHEGGVWVSKSWMTLQGRRFLVEEVPVVALADELAQLPVPQTASTGPKVNPALHVVSTKRPLPAPRVAKSNPSVRFMQAAQATAPSRGLVLDYVTLSGQTAYTFRGDTTYYVSGYVGLFDTNTFEGGAVIKYATNGEIVISPGPPGTSPGINWKANAYHPVIFTAKDDNSVGESFGTGNPTGYYGNPMLYPVGFSPQVSLSGLRMAYAQTAIESSGIAAKIYDAQFVNCHNGLMLVGGPVFLGNALFVNTATNFIYQGGLTIIAQNTTFSDSLFLAMSPGGGGLTYLALTNCILANVSNIVYGSFYSMNGNHNGFYNSPEFGANPVTNSFNPFQSVGAGNYYLTNGCAFTNAGTNRIDSTLLASLRTKTTHPPVVFTQAAISNNFIFSPQVPRDTNSNPDLGYHYDPIDYAVGGVSFNNAIVAVYPGTVIAAFGTGDNAFGLDLGTGTEFLCKGLATNWNRIVAYNTVQEQAGAAWQAPTNGLITDTSGGSSSSLDCRFTDWSVPAQDEAFLAVTNQNSETSVALRDCQFHGGSLVLDYISAADPAINNCLFDRVNLVLSATLGTVFSVQNNLFWRGAFNFAPTANDSVVQNNLFDQTVIPDNSATYGTYIGGYNAYVTNCNQLQPASVNDLVLTNPPVYQVGPLGNYYQPSNSRLINAGSTSADQLGLYDYTVVTNLIGGHEIKETNSIVDIGYHYVAVDSNCVPLTTYTNGLPDYLVTSSTDLIADWWELIYFGNLDQAADGDYDNDGTNNLTEYQNSTDPNKISFSISFPNQYVSTNIVTGVITILGGVPSSIATLVDNTNFAGATWTAYTSPNITVNLGSTQGPHDVWIGLRGLPANAQQTWEDTTLILDSTSPSITITNPADGVSFNASRVNVFGNFTAASLHQITVNDIVAFVNGTNFEALNVTLAGGANTITAVIEDLTGVTNAFSINVTGLTNSDGSMNSPVQLQATPVAGFAPLTVTFSVQANVPGTIQQVFYDFNGDDLADFATNNLDSFTYTYETNGEYFPVVTIQTDAGRFSSVGGWNAVALDPSNQPVQINVQAALTQTVFISNISDPVDLKWTGTNLFVLSGSSGTITEFDTNGSPVGTPFVIGAASSGFDVDRCRKCLCGGHGRQSGLEIQSIRRIVCS